MGAHFIKRLWLIDQSDGGAIVVLLHTNWYRIAMNASI
jgi:hypothetical protein